MTLTDAPAAPFHDAVPDAAPPTAARGLPDLRDPQVRALPVSVLALACALMERRCLPA
jgi:hypothetical protein